MKPDKVKFWRQEMVILDKLYDTRMAEWQQTADLYDMKFKKQIRDLDPEDLVKIPRFYPLVRQIIGTIAFNYPKLLFKIEDDEGDTGHVEVLQRASAALMELMSAKPHIHQAIFDALFCGVGWLRNDFNPPGNELIPPYIANDAMEEDLTALSRVAPGFVQLDPSCPPHMFGHAAYIRERMWVPYEFLMEEKGLHNRDHIKASGGEEATKLGFGEPMYDDGNSPSAEAARDSIKNRGHVLLDRFHDRWGKKLITFAEGVMEPIKEEDHPFRKLVFDQEVDSQGQPIFDDNGEPTIDVNKGTEGTGWLVQNGFQFIPVKFDLHPSSFYPKAHLKYVEDMQFGIVESMSRQASLLKRTSRQGVVNKDESLANPGLKEALRKGVDGEYHDVLDVNNIRPLENSSVPLDQLGFEDRLLMYEEEVTRVTELGKDGPVRSATEAALIGAAVAVNKEWMEVGVAKVYEDVVRNSFQIMGDPRFTPDNFKVNVAPDGFARVSRALRAADFLWTYRITVKAGSMSPLFAQMQQERFLQFYDRTLGSPNFDRMKMDKLMSIAFDTDPDTVMIEDINEDARRLAELENEGVITEFKAPLIEPGQDHRSHIKTHEQYQSDPLYQQYQQQAQQVDFQGNAATQSAQAVQFIDQTIQQHIQEHADAEQQEATLSVGGEAPAPQAADLGEQIRSNAQNISQVVTAETLYQ
tara:strand:- start:3288 stop:5372 length:2085 start_codon:yes stop_codon:yes gene_type:complete